MNELNLQLSTLLDQLNILYPRGKKTPAVSANIDKAKSIIKARKSTEDDYKQEIQQLQQLIDQKHESDKRELLDLQKQDDEKREKHAQAVKAALESPDSINSDTLEKLAKHSPDTNGQNPFRPDWTFYDSSSMKWKLDANKLATDIAADQQVRRVEEKGKITNYTKYNYMLGQWETIAPEDLGNFIDDYFANPAKHSDSNNNMFAKDLETGKALRDTLTLLKAKIKKINAEVFDQPPKYLVHCKSYDFDILNWKRVDFSPDHYFISGLAFNPDKSAMENLSLLVGLKETPEAVEKIKYFTDQIAPIVQKWLLLSLKDEDSVKTIIERLGLSMLHNYDENFIVFLQSTKAHIGKSAAFDYFGSLFQEDSVTALDLDQMAEGGSFDASELRDHEINLTSEVKTRFISDYALNALKGLSSGDEKNFPQKHTHTARFKNTAHLWFNMNYLPRLATYDDAVARRMDVFKWHGIKHFDSVIGMENLNKERPQLIALAMFYAHQELNREPYDYKYCGAELRLTRSSSMIQAYQEWSSTNDLFKRFIDEKCTLGAEYKIGVGYLVKEINNYFAEIGEDNVHYHTNDLSNKLSLYGIYQSPKRGNWQDESRRWHTGVYVYEGITLQTIAPVNKETEDFNQEQEAAGKERKNAMYARDLARHEANQQKGVPKNGR